MRGLLSSRVIILLAVAILAALFLALHGTAEAQGHSAVRSLSAEWVEPGGRLEVSVSAEGYGAIGQVVETLPEGFAYQGSDMPESSVFMEGRTIAFTLFQSSSFSYVVTAPAEEGTYAFSGTVKDFSRQERPVTGASTVGVGPPPTPEPTPTPTATPTVAPTPAPALSPTPFATVISVPTAAPTPVPSATPEPTTTPMPTEAPAVTPAASPTRRLTATPTTTLAPTARPNRIPTATIAPTLTATLEPTPLAGLASAPFGGSRTASPPPAPADSMGGLPTWVMAATVGGVAALFVAGLVAIYVLARRRREERWGYRRW